MSAIGCGWLGWLGTLVFRGRNGMDWVMTLFFLSLSFGWWVGGGLAMLFGFIMKFDVFCQFGLFSDVPPSFPWFL